MRHATCDLRLSLRCDAHVAHFVLVACSPAVRAVCEPAACNAQRATCNVQHAQPPTEPLLNLQHTTCNMHHATCSAAREPATCDMQHASCNAAQPPPVPPVNLQHVTCNTQRAAMGYDDRLQIRPMQLSPNPRRWQSTPRRTESIVEKARRWQSTPRHARSTSRRTSILCKACRPYPRLCKA